MINRFEPHSHTYYSNIRLLDAINSPKDLINRAINLGLSGIAITDHDCLSSHIQVNQYAQEIKEKYPNFKIALGNEIYLCPNREKGQKYFHFILIAKNKDGHKALRELSSRAWMNSYWDRGLERVVTTYDDLVEIYNKYPNSLIATSACLGGELSIATLNLINAEIIKDENGRIKAYNNIVDFITFCKELFHKDFYIECAPGQSNEQIAVNKRLVSIAKCFNIKMVIGTDAHYLTKEDRYVHKAYLNSKGGEREVDSFYEFSYLQSNEEIQENLKLSIINEYETMVENSFEIYNKIEDYSLLHNQKIPYVEVTNYPIHNCQIDKNLYPTLAQLNDSDNKQDRYWINECLKALKEKENTGIIDKTNHNIYIQRLEEEANIKKYIGEQLGTNMFQYPNTLQHYVNLFWKCGSPVGAGRGSSCSGLNHYLLGITQLDPIKWNLPFFRYLNKERTELGDIDIDLAPSRRPLIIKKIKEERGENFNSDIDELSRQNLGCTLIATFGTEGTKSAILTACRGYRSKEYPDGIDSDTAQYMASLIPSERGFLWPLKDVIEGNKEKGRKPITTFIKEVNQYPRLLEIMSAIEGVVNKRSSHASGVILFDNDPYEFGCFMKTPKGEIITQYDLHTLEAAGGTKYDFLVTEVQDKIAETIRLLQRYNEIESNLSLKEVYDKYFHPDVININDSKVWDAIKTNSVLNIFQFDSDVGSQAAKKIQPSNMNELADANGLMRLMTSEKGQESPLDKYVRFKNNIQLWYDEMNKAGLTKEEQKYLEPYYLSSYGVPPSQEQLMLMLMDKNICNFSLAESNAARKIVGKKQMDKIPELHQKILDKAMSKNLGNYIWETGVGPQMGYSFSIIHALAYSFIGYHTAYLATNWNPIYWNTACLIVNSGSLQTDNEEENIETKEKTTDYTKITKALNDSISKGIKISLIDINKSSYSFEPDIVNNQILFGLKALSGINDDIINKIIINRPYKSFKDFLIRCPLNKTAMISLIKAGSFDNLEQSWGKEFNIETRYIVMIYYLLQVYEKKKRLTLQNLNGLIQNNLIPNDLSKQKNIYLFNKYLKTNKIGQYYLLDQKSEEFYLQYFNSELLNSVNGYTCIIQKDWDKIYKKEMDEVRNWLQINQNEILNQYNNILFNEIWNKYALGTLASWEMDSVCFYYHPHELQNVNYNKYGIIDFNSLPEEPKVDYFFKRNGRQIPIYTTYKIIGTVISKNDVKSSISLLTMTGIVNVKFTKDYYAMFNRQLSEVQPNGTKKVIDKSWFIRGTKIMCTGFRREDTFVAKTYTKTQTHQLYKIIDVKDNGDLELIHERTKENNV